MNPSTRVVTGRLPAILLICAALAGASMPCAAQEDYRHVVREGETLIGIGAALLQEPRDWPQIQRHNRISQPRHLHPGSTLRIPLALLRREAVDAQVAAVRGEVSADGTPLAVGDRIGQGRELTSGDESFATITLADGSQLVLQPRSRL